MYCLEKQIASPIYINSLIFPFLHTVGNAFGSSKTFYKLINLCQLIKWMSYPH